MVTAVGQVNAEGNVGAPEEIARVKKSYTGQALRPLLNGHATNGNGHAQVGGGKTAKAVDANGKKPARGKRKDAA